MPNAAQRLSGSFRDRLLTWHHSGFSVSGAQVVLPGETGRIAHLARYATRPPLAAQRVQQGPGQDYLLSTQPDPATWVGHPGLRFEFRAYDWSLNAR